VYYTTKKRLNCKLLTEGDLPTNYQCHDNTGRFGIGTLKKWINTRVSHLRTILTLGVEANCETCAISHTQTQRVKRGIENLVST